MENVREELERLRREMDEVLARLPARETRDSEEAGTEALPGAVNNALLRDLRENLRKQNKTRGIAICRVVISCNEGGTACRSGIIMMTSADDLPKGDRLSPSVTTLATDPLALRAMRTLTAPYFEGHRMQMTTTALAAALGASEAEVETSLRPLVADNMLLWSKTAEGEEYYEMQDQDPHVLLLQSLE
jgi:hypothetical protein